MDENNVTENLSAEQPVGVAPPKKEANTMIPYIVALAGAVLSVAADFIPYIEVSNFFFTRKVSIFSLITETLDDTERMLGSIGDKIVFGAIIAAVVFSLLVVLFTAIRKMVPAIVFIVLTALPFLMLGSAFVHYIGLVIALVGAIWYKIADSQVKRNKA